MKIPSLISFYFAIICAIAQNNYTQYVNPMIGTGGHGHTFPGATMPFAMVQLSPDTRIDGSWDGCSGYHYSDSIIYGFSHTHLSGTGCSEYGDIMIMPKMGEPSFDKNDYTSKFKHSTEKANAGYYAVKLEKDNIDVQLSSTTRVGIHEYKFNKNGKVSILLDLQHRDKLIDGIIRVIDNQTIEGWRRSEAWATDQLVYYRIQFSKPFVSKNILSGDNWDYNANFNFNIKKGEAIVVKVSLSSVDETGAKANMEKELLHWNFEKVKQDANKAWNTELNRIKAYGGTKTEKINFYTALYHCMIHPNIMNDIDGRYRGRDKQVHYAVGFDYYTVFSLWDTHRALHPLLNIIDKKRSHDFMMTFKAQYEQSGRLPMWELWGNETNCMIGFHSVSVILDAYNKEVITLQELKDLYPAVKAEAMSNRFGLDKFREKGYLSIEDESESVSKTLEYSYDFYCVARIAIECEFNEDYDYFEKLSNGWVNVYNAQTGFMTPRKNGGWLTPFDPTQVNNHYTEANAWQYSFAVPHNSHLIADNKKIVQLFYTDSKTTGREQADITGLIGQYAHGNEPSHHIPYLYHKNDKYSGLKEELVKKICNELYKPTPDGLCGNEDCGQMSAWYVFSAMGFYPVNPSSNDYYFGNMIFDSVCFNTKDTISYIHKKFPIHYTNKKNSISQYNDFFTFDKLNNPIFFGKSNINDWNNLLPKKSTYEFEYYRSSPIIVSNSDIFKDSFFIEIIANDKDKILHPQIYYQIDNGIFLEYAKPIKINKNAKIKAFEIFEYNDYNLNHPGRFIVSDTSIAHFFKKPNNYNIKINSTYNKQYTADGDEGLIDGLQGDIDWRKGRWQGYQSQDFEAIVDLQEIKTVSSISAGFLQDTRSWILMPTQVVYYGSIDGVIFEEISTLKNEIADSNYTIQRKAFEVKIKTKPFRYIKVKANNYGVLPAWHQGYGGNAFIFIDEIEVK